VIGCFNPQWAAQLAGAQANELEQVRRSERVLTPWMWSAVGLGVALLPRVHAFLMPTLVALNFGTSAVELEFDTGERLRVDPTSLESERAGSRVRLAAGNHKLKVVSLEGQLIEERELRIQTGALHLLSISGEQYCFWLEQESYGQVAGAAPSYRLLEPSAGFWAIEARVDAVFAANPPASSDRASSGGTMTALRQGRCDALPPALGGPAAPSALGGS
jgi:hypothetical protein